MKFPATNAPRLFQMSPAAKFVTFNSSLAVSAVIDKVSGKAAVQATTAAQPTWGSASIAGTYIATNWPGVQGIPGLTFSGAQSLEFDTLPTYPSVDGYVGLTVTCVASCTAPSGGTAQTIWALGSSTGATPTLSLVYQSSTLKLIEVNANGTYTASATIDSNVHVITASRTAAGALSLRVDALPVASGSVTMAGDTFNTFCLGATNSNGTINKFLTGTLGDLVVFGSGTADIDTTEAFLLQQVGIDRTFTSA